eukprot:9503898-Pyramimonas_sp.AAC.2
MSSPQDEAKLRGAILPVGTEIEVYWVDDAQYYPGRVAAFDEVRKVHRVVYADGDEEVLDLTKETFNVLGKCKRYSSGCAVSWHHASGPLPSW